MRRAIVAGLLLAAAGLTAVWLRSSNDDAGRAGNRPYADSGGPIRSRRVQVRTELFAELRPVPLRNCVLERFGEKHDGGYLMCGNLLQDATAAYSYGINGYDQWGCDVSRRRGVRVHQYDCFNLTEPACTGGTTVFHAECIAGLRFTDKDGRLFDTFASQFAKNGDDRGTLIVKIDVEGAEWESFARTSDEVLNRIDQLVVEFHGVEDPSYVHVVRRLKRFFHVAHRHFNNVSCTAYLRPFPAWAYEVLFVNKRIGKAAWWGNAPLPHPQDAPNSPDVPDCQGTAR